MVVEDSSVRHASSDHLNKAAAGYLEKIVEKDVEGDALSTKNHNDHGQIDNNSTELSMIKRVRGKKCRRKKRKRFDSTVSNLGSIQEGTCPSVVVVEDSSVRDAFSDHLDKAAAGYSEKIMGENVTGNASSTNNHDDNGQVDVNSCI